MTQDHYDLDDPIDAAKYCLEFGYEHAETVVHYLGDVPNYLDGARRTRAEQLIAEAKKIMGKIEMLRDELVDDLPNPAPILDAVNHPEDGSSFISDRVEFRYLAEVGEWVAWGVIVEPPDGI